MIPSAPQRLTHGRTSALSPVGGLFARYGLVVVIIWIGALKFSAYEAAGIQLYVANSPLMGWVYNFLSVRTFSSLLGVFEILTAILLAVKPRWARVSVAGGAMASLMFAMTVSFLFTTPGVVEQIPGDILVLSDTGQFLIKDVALLGIALWALADSLDEARQRTA